MNSKSIFFLLTGIVGASIFLWVGVSSALGETHEAKCMRYADEIIKNWEASGYNYEEFNEKVGWLFSNMHNELCMKTEAWKKLQDYQFDATN